MAQRRVPQLSATRWRILEILKRAGQATVKELCRAMEMTDTGVRQHLALLERDRLVFTEKLPSKMGRPSYGYVLTDEGLNLFPKQYARLTRWILEEVRQSEGEQGITDLMQRLAQRIGRSYASRFLEDSLEQRVRQLTQMLAEDGALAEWSTTEGGYFIDEYNCPYWDVADEYPQVCAMDEQIVGIALGIEVEHWECMAKGAPRCRHFIPSSIGVGA